MKKCAGGRTTLVSASLEILSHESVFSGLKSLLRFTVQRLMPSCF